MRILTLYRERHKELFRQIVKIRRGLLGKVYSEEGFEKLWQEIGQEIQKTGVYDLEGIRIVTPLFSFGAERDRFVKDGDLAPVYGVMSGEYDLVIGASGIAETTMKIAKAMAYGLSYSVDFATPDILAEDARGSNVLVHRHLFGVEAVKALAENNVVPPEVVSIIMDNALSRQEKRTRIMGAYRTHFEEAAKKVERISVKAKSAKAFYEISETDIFLLATSLAKRGDAIPWDRGFCSKDKPRTRVVCD